MLVFRFYFPARKDVTVLNDINLVIPTGKTIALVGSSGCGKSTCIQLIQRFYDTDQGQVFIDGVDIKSINLKWLRKSIGVVRQEPALFDCNIRDNILLAKPDATEEEIWKACEEANAADFISSLPNRNVLNSTIYCIDKHPTCKIVFIICETL